MKKTILITSLISFLIGQSNHATMTLYKDGYALIKQPVAWNAQEGESTISWNLLPGGIIKDSPFLTLENATVKTQRYNQDVFHFSDHLYDYLGKTIDVEFTNGNSLTGTLIELSGNIITITRKRSVISFDRDKVDYINVPGKLENILFKPSLTWNVFKKKMGPARGSLIYLSKGFDWDAIYRLILDESRGRCRIHC